MCLPKGYMNVALYRNRVSADVINMQCKIDQAGSGRALNPTTGVFMTREDRETGRGGGRDQSDVSTSLGSPRICHQKWRRQKASSPEPWGEPGPKTP